MNATLDARVLTAHQQPSTAAHAAITGSSWPRVVASFVDQLNADAGGIVVQSLASGRGRVLHGINLPVDCAWNCDERATFDEYWLQTVGKLVTPGVVRQTRLPTHGTARGPLFRRWLQPNGLQRILFAALSRTDETVVFLVLMRHTNGHRFTSRELREVQVMLPVLVSSWHLERGARAQAAVVNAAWGVLDILSLGVIVANREGVVSDMNNRARRLIGRGSGLIIRQGKLRCRGHRDDQLLGNFLAAIADAASEPAPASERALSIARSGDDAPLRLMLVRLGDCGWHQGQQEPLVAVFLSDSKGSTSPKERWFRDLYGLTRMEAEVAALLCHGHHPKEIAERLRISVHTVRGYMTQIFSKAGVSRQTELLRQFMLFAGRFNGTPEADAA